MESPAVAPASLNAETKGIWNGWNLIGNKEVAREAATKGTHIQLALLFLKSRNKLDEKDTLKWFNEEILDWVSELLRRQQIFKASHILTNINLDPTEEITKVFVNCIDNDLRSYLGNYLVKLDKLCDELKHNWSLLNKIIESNGLCGVKLETYSNIASIQQLQYDEKQDIAAKLYVKSLDDDLIFFLQPFPLWKSLLESDNINFILAWINRLYSKAYNELFSKSINTLFSTFPINVDMINAIQESEISHVNKTCILNEFCKYGIFLDTERNNVTDIVRRVCDIRELTNINNILTNSSVIDMKKFYRLLVVYCLENNFHGLLGFCTVNFNNLEDIQHEIKCSHFDTIIEFRNMFNNLHDVEVMRKNIYNVAKIITKNIDIYFEENPLILLALIILTKDIDLASIFEFKNTISISNYNFPINVILKNYAIINNIVSKMSISSYKSDISQYDLIETYHEINLKDILKFRFNSSIAFPNFNCPILVQKYGYNKRIKYLTYVKYGRPILATNFFNINLLQASYSKSKIQKLAFRNFLDPLIVSSCIIFTELIGSNSEYLRCHISAARIILANELEILEELILLLENINECSSNFLLLLETSVMKQININVKSTGVEVINAMKYYSIVVQFTILHNLPLPLKFLKYCAQNNLWLPYLMHLQKYNYPVEVSQKAIQCCRNEILLEHLQHCLLNDVQVEKKKTPKSRDSRSFYLSRIGMRKNVKEDAQTTSADGLLQSSVTSQSSYGSATSSSGLSDFIDSDTLDLKTSLLQTIIKCHNSTDPPRALLQACEYYNYPLFAILATSYEPDSVIKNWLTWLTVSCDIHKQFVIYDKVTTSASLVSEILQTTIKNGFCKTLEQSLQIFLTDNPLKIFIRFLNECMKLHYDESILTESLNKFKSTIKFKRSNSIISENDHEMTYLNNKLWLEQTAIILLATMLQFNFKSRYEQIKLLQFLNINFKECFIGNVPDFFKLLQIANILIKTTVTLNFSVIYDQNCYRKELVNILEKLVDNKNFDEALEIAKVENSARDKILIKRLKFEYESESNHAFWGYCNEEFIKHNISATDIVEFYIEFYSKSVHCEEQISILKVAQNWAATHNLDSLYDIEKNLWIIYFREPELSKKFTLNTTYTYLTYKDVMSKLNSYKIKPIASENKLNHQQCEVAIAELLNCGDIFQALRFERMFDYKNTDLEIIKLCMSLAEGLVLPYQLSAEQRLLITKGNNTMSLNHRRRTFLSTRLSSMSSSSHSPYACNQRFSPLTEPLVLNTSVQDAIIILECLIDRLKAGLDFAQRILMLYRISANIDRDYKTLIDIRDSEGSFGLLRTVLAEDCRNKLEVVHDFVQVYKWTREEVSDFLCEEIITCLNAQVKLKTDIFFLWDLQMDNDFQMILQLLLDNCTMLGHKLYSYASAVHHSEMATSAVFRQEEFSLVIELLIRAHDCYTADCNMEGISVILKKCRALIGYMLTKDCWKLIVRLLTGVGRYTEMNYVFQILREHDQFEFLLRKGARKDNGLKLALLEYLKKYCPENRELYRMVALHFTLFSEVAELWENEADGIIRNLIAISKLEMQNQRLNPDTEPFVIFTNTDGTKLCLNKAMVNYTHAAEYHLQGEKLSKAMKSARQAELLALQLSLLKNIPANSTTTCLLHLTRDQINRLLSFELTFPQAVILIEAYNHNVDWATVLFKQFIIDNKQSYFDNFIRTIPLTDTLVHNLSRRYLSDRTLPDTAIVNMKSVLRNVTAIGVKYKIASELVFTDILEELLAGDQLAYLKDTVWKKGYKD